MPGHLACPLRETDVLATTDRIAVRQDHSAAAAFVHLSDGLTAVFDENLVLLMQTDTAEPVHKARVALRRFRAAIAAFAPVLDEDLAGRLQDRSRALFRLLGGIRDADVMADRFAGTDLAASTQARAAEERRKGRRLLKKTKAAGFHNWVGKRLSGKTWRRSGKKAKALREAPVAELARLALAQAWAASLSNGPDLTAMSPRAQHELRKDLKVLRYLCEFFADLWPGAAQDAFLDDLRALQDDLGELTDSATAHALGHEMEGDTSAHQARAAAAWQALLTEGPWWA